MSTYVCYLLCQYFVYNPKISYTRTIVPGFESVAQVTIMDTEASLKLSLERDHLLHICLPFNHTYVNW